MPYRPGFFRCRFYDYDYDAAGCGKVCRVVRCQVTATDADVRCQVTATDVDAGDNSRIRYVIPPHSHSASMFHVDQRGVVSSLSSINREEYGRFRFPVVAVDAGTPSRTGTAPVPDPVPPRPWYSGTRRSTAPCPRSLILLRPVTDRLSHSPWTKRPRPSTSLMGVTVIPVPLPTLVLCPRGFSRTFVTDQLSDCTYFITIEHTSYTK